jgi:hypothetical protein
MNQATTKIWRRKASNTPKVEWEIKIKQLQGNKEVN